MLTLDTGRREELRARFLPDRPGPLIGLHTIGTGHGACFVDRWPDPRAVLVGADPNFALLGEPDALGVEDLRPRVDGMVDAPEAFAPLLKKAFPPMRVWDRLIYELLEAPPSPPTPGFELRRLDERDAHHLWGLDLELQWIAETLGGPSGLAASGLAWGAFSEGTLAAVATPFFVGERYEDIGIVTGAAFRGRGLSPACAAKVAVDVRARGRTPSWSTSRDNPQSQRVAEKLGFRLQREDCLYAVDGKIPAPV